MKGKEVISKEHGLMGNLLRILQQYNIKIKIDLKSDKIDSLTQQNLYWLITDDKTTNISNTTFSLFATHDALAVNTQISLKNKLKKSKDYIEHLESHIVLPDDVFFDKNEITAFLIDALNNTHTYYPNTNSKQERKYSVEDKEKLIELYRIQEYSLMYTLYLYIYFTITKHNPSNFYYGIKSEHDMREFENEVIYKYGTTSNAGLRAIIALAKKDEPNIFAMYEYAEMYYYGMNSSAQSYTKAFEWYFKAAGLEPPTKTNFFSGKLKKIGESYCNPLALWSIAYILFNYHRSGDLIDCDNISYIDDLYDYGNTRPDEIIIHMALYYAYKAYTLNDTGASSNLLGNILTRMTDDDLKYYVDLLRKEDNIELIIPPSDYYKVSMERDYVYGYNNYAAIIAKKIQEKSEDSTNLINQYISLLEHSATKIDTWALNSLGLYYLKGKIGDYIDENATLDKIKAKKYFQNATMAFIDYGSIWACVNLLINYSDEYNNDPTFKDICKKILECENPEAYKSIFLFFSNKDCPYSKSNIEYFKTISHKYLNSGKVTNNSKYYKELVEFCEG